MNAQSDPNRAARVWGVALVIAIAMLTLTSTGRAAASRFLASLRIPKPQVVSVNVTGAAGSGGRALQNMIGGMIAKMVTVALDEADQPVPTAAAAGKSAGFAPALPRARTDAVTLSVLGAHAVEMTVDLGQLRTVLAEAGRSDVPFPPSVQGAKVVLRTPRAVRAQYGNCPAPAAATIQGQLQGTPPPSTENADCVVLVETPAVSAEVPAGLDVAPLMEIALELSGMNPVQAHAFPRTFDWKSILAISVPRNLRSYEMKEVNGAPAVLLNTAGRRGPTWALLWTKNGMVYSLAGYGSAADAVPLATSID